MTMLSTVLSPMTAYAAEIQPEEKPPLYEEVKDLLDEDEVVTAKDYEIETGSVFDVKSDYTGLEIKDDNKVKVTFEEAKNDKDEDFTTDHADTYKAVYYVEPVNQEHPKYQISRKLIVREKATEAQTETAGSEAVTESETAGSEQQTEEAEDSEADSEITDIDADEFDDLVEQAQNQDTYDEESGLELHDVLEQAGDEGVDLDAMEEGEIATFEAVSAYSARSTQQVTIEKGPLYRYADYNLGTYLTEPYYISYGSVRATAYCVQPAKPGPGSGNYTITKIGDNQALAKVCYYGTDAAGSESFFANKHRRHEPVPEVRDEGRRPSERRPHLDRGREEHKALRPAGVRVSVVEHKVAPRRIAAEPHLVDLPRKDVGLLLHDAPPDVRRRGHHVGGLRAAAGQKHRPHQNAVRRKRLRNVGEGPRRVAEPVHEQDPAPVGMLGAVLLRQVRLELHLPALVRVEHEAAVGADPRLCVGRILREARLAERHNVPLRVLERRCGTARDGKQNRGGEDSGTDEHEGLLKTGG